MQADLSIEIGSRELFTINGCNNNFQRVICPKEYRRVVKVISDILSDAIEMVQVVFNNDQMTFGNRLHVRN